MRFSQLDFTERFGDGQRMGADEWIATIPLNSRVKQPERSGLPPIGAPDDAVFRLADALSKVRERLRLPRDGVYCPICHIANPSLGRLRTPCPRCDRPLLEFGWD